MNRASRSRTSFLARGFTEQASPPRRPNTADLIRDRALAFIDGNKDRPFFLYFASTLPHANNESKPNGMEIPDYGPYRDKPWPPSEKGQAAMITRLDSDVGQLLHELKKDRLEDQTVVLFASDNGPHHEGGHDPKFFDDNGPLRGTKRDLYEGGIRVPLIVRWPGHVPSATVCDYVGYFGDFFATAAEIAGTACPAGLDSISFLSAMTGHGGQQTNHRIFVLGILRAGFQTGRADRELEGCDPSDWIALSGTLQFANRSRRKAGRLAEQSRGGEANSLDRPIGARSHSALACRKNLGGRSNEA